MSGPVAAFLAHLAVERQGSAHTLAAYRRDLDALTAWAEGRDLLALTREDLRGFIAAEHRRGLSPKSLQRRLSACRSLYRWLLKQGRIAADPSAGVRAPKALRKLPQVLDVDEAVRLVELPTDGPLGLRDRARVHCQVASAMLAAATAQVDAGQADEAVRTITQAINSLAALRHRYAQATP